MKHLLKLIDLSQSDIYSILNLADQLKFERKNSIKHNYCMGKKLGMIFEKSSTRTRVSFEVGMYELGGTALFLSSSDIQLGRGESIKDTARVLSRYLDAIMIRTYKQQDVEDLATYSSIPIINGLTDDWHPCQVLADLMTIREYKGDFKKLKLCYIGDGNNMANSLMVGAVKMGMSFCIACPKGYEPNNTALSWAKQNGDVTVTDDIFVAAKDADIVYTDVWASMGQESQKIEREKAFKNYKVDSTLLKNAKSDVILLHCLPAHREEEITDEVFEEHSAEIFEQAENRLHAQKAVLVKLLK